MSLQPIKRALLSTSGRLAASYLAVIMVMSLGYSLAIYNTSAHELQRQLPPRTLFQEEEQAAGRIGGQASGTGDQNTAGSQANQGNSSGDYGGEFSPPPRVSEFLKRRAAEGRHALLMRLAILNGATLLLGTGLSIYLARRTLRPIEESVEARTQFVSDASHELRTPLTAIQTGNEVALRSRTLTLPQSKKLLQQNIEEVAKLQALTDGLLRLAGTDGNKLLLKPESLQDVVTDAMNRIVDIAQSKRIGVEDSMPPLTVMADRQSLAQAVVILLDNAVKYSPAGTTVQLTGGRRGRQVFMQVRDHGPGIRPYDLRRIFDRFYRADQSRSTQLVPGHGIGLSLAQKIVRQHGGEIRVVSNTAPSKSGSTFTIWLPQS